MVRLLTRAEAAAELRISPRSLRRLSIPVVRIGRKPLYDQKDLDYFKNVASGWIDAWHDASPLGKKLMDAVALRLEVSRAHRVYFVQSAYMVKIGYSVHAAARLDAINTHTPYGATMLGTIKGDLFTEKALHKAVKAWRARREWFHLSTDLAIAIDELCKADKALEAR